MRDLDPNACARTGVLIRLGELELDGPRPDVWRAPIDNDLLNAFGEPQAGAWLTAGLHRMRHDVPGVGPDASRRTVTARPAASGSSSGLGVVCRWTACDTPDADRARLRLDTLATPDGPWSVPLPRLGVAMSLPGTDADVEWSGPGPGEADRDSHAAVRPQENGNRHPVRRARTTTPDGTLLITGDPVIECRRGPPARPGPRRRTPSAPRPRAPRSGHRVRRGVRHRR
ncbi:hypothetical protein ABZ646_12455 [Streptomyces sp. NPDC007162]|uniref:hypothetical protein n=1 Tax=Streptomyces sp. NPDC007162 TaxID=3156917 RepID=UPI003402AD66